MKKTIAAVLSAGLVLALLAGCNGTKPLPEGLDAATIEADAQEMVETLNGRDWAGMNDYGIDESLTEEAWAETFEPILDELGAFDSYTEIKSTGYTDKKTDTEYGIVVLKAKYENGTKAYQVTFSKDGDVAGFHIVG